MSSVAECCSRELVCLGTAPGCAGVSWNSVRSCVGVSRSSVRGGRCMEDGGGVITATGPQEMESG